MRIAAKLVCTGGHLHLLWTGWDTAVLCVGCVVAGFVVAAVLFLARS